MGCKQTEKGFLNYEEPATFFSELYFDPASASMRIFFIASVLK